MVCTKTVPPNNAFLKDHLDVIDRLTVASSFFSIIVAPFFGFLNPNLLKLPVKTIFEKNLISSKEPPSNFGLMGGGHFYLRLNFI